MEQFNSEVENITEGYGLMKTVIRERFPSKLKLSEKFIQTFREEFKNQTAAVFTEDEDGNQIKAEGRSKKKVLREMQKALAFLSKPF